MACKELRLWNVCSNDRSYAQHDARSYFQTKWKGGHSTRLLKKVSDQLIIAISVVNTMFSVCMYFQVVFKTSTYAGLVGIFTAQRQNQFTLSIDERGTVTNLFFS